MPYRVLFAEDAERDIEDLYRFLATRDGIQTAERILGEIEESCLELEDLPTRGMFPRNWWASASPNTGNYITSSGG